MVRVFAIVVLVAAGVGLLPLPAAAHCDALDGPVVQAARTALNTNQVDLVLWWVPREHEAEIRAAFERTVKVRALGEEARALADTWFFETLVRIHREGEDAPFDGLKPAGHIEPFVASVDRTLATGSADALVGTVSEQISHALRARFVRARDARARATESVAAGREYVAAYVDYMHYVEALHKAGAHGEHAESAVRH